MNIDDLNLKLQEVIFEISLEKAINLDSFYRYWSQFTVESAHSWIY